MFATVSTSKLAMWTCRFPLRQSVFQAALNYKNALGLFLFVTICWGNYEKDNSAIITIKCELITG